MWRSTKDVICSSLRVSRRASHFWIASYASNTSVSFWQRTTVRDAPIARSFAPRAPSLSIARRNPLPRRPRSQQRRSRKEILMIVHDDEPRLMKGNEALAEAAIRAGLQAYFGYPITP